MNFPSIGKEKLPSVINDPFSKNKIIAIRVHYTNWMGKGDWSCSGKIEFQNGDTKGEQTFSGDTFDNVVAQMKAVIESL